MTYSLVGTDSSSFSVDTADGQWKAKAALDYETTPTYSVTVTDRKDEQGNTEQNPTTDANIVVTIDVANVDESGVATLSTMATVEIGTAITAPLSDPGSGVDNESWQWQRRRASASAM